MSVIVRVPTQLRSLTGGKAEVAADGGTVAAILAAVEKENPGLGERIFDENGSLRRFINVFVADEDVRFLDGLQTVVAEGQTVSIVPAVAGG